VAASLVLFFLLCEIVLKPGVLPFLGLEQARETAAKFSSPPVLAALVLTTLLPNTAVVSAGDAWLLRRFQSWGRIPEGVRNLADALTQGAFAIVETDLPDLRAWIMSEGGVPNDLAARVSVDPVDTPQGCLTRALELFRQMQKLESNAQYSNAFRARQEEWQAIQAEIRVFTAQSQAFFVLFDQLTPVEGTAGTEALKNARICYHDICLHLHRKLAEFLARLLLVVEASDIRISSRLQSLGFCFAEAPCPPLHAGPFVFMGTMMIIAILCVVAIVPPPPTRRLPIGLIAILIGTTQTIGVLTAVLPKLRWSKFRTDGRGNPPYFAWLEWALLAGVTSFLIDRTAVAIVNHAASAELDFTHYPLSPIGPMAFGVSLVIAVICDVDLKLGEGWARHVTEGMLCGAAMVVDIFICTQLLDIASATKGQAPYWFPFVFSFSLGFTSGFFAPSLYRRARGERIRGDAAIPHPA
jgi:hypothetical protein